MNGVREDVQHEVWGAELHRALRQVTQQAHAEINRLPLMAGLLEPGLTRGAYGRALQALYAINGPVEARIEDYLAHAGLPFDFSAHRRLADLAADLDALGLVRPFKAWAGPTIRSPAALVGNLYVLLGSNLGGRVIFRHVQVCLGVLPDHGGRFFHGRGRDFQALWASFWQFAASFCPPDDLPEAQAAAFALFSQINVLMAGRDACASSANSLESST